MEPAPVSVVMPTYNCGAYIVEAIVSVLAQTRPPAQVIVVDDGSDDDTARRLAPYAGRVEYVFQANAGVSAARNLGVSLANQPFVAFLDADDVWHPQKLELQMAVFERRPDLGILSAGEREWPAEPFSPVAGPARLPVVDISWDEMAVRNRMSTSGIVVRRSVLERVGQFDTSMQGPEDRDLWIRIVEVAPGASLELPLFGYRGRPDGISRAADRCCQGMGRILSKLDQRRAWGGRWLLRRRAYSYMNHSCAYLYAAAGRPWTALRFSLRSLGWYPLPHRPGDTAQPFERSKRFAVILLRLLGLKPLPPGAALPQDRSPRGGGGPACAAS